MAWILHPLWGVPCPTLDDLLARADPEAAVVLRSAARLAGWRLDAQRRALAIKAELETTPWSPPSLEWPMSPRAMLPADLARALLVERPHLLLDAQFAHEPAAREPFEDARRRWSRVLEASPAEPEALPLLRPWARRLALGRLDHPTLRLEPRHLVSASLVPEWIELSGRYHDGLVTREEAHDRLYDGLAVAAERGIVPRTAIDPLVPEPYVDHHDGVRALERALVAGPGAVLLGPEGSGRRSLVRACQWRHRRREGPRELRGHGFNLDRFYVTPTLHEHEEGARLELPPEMSDRCVFALVREGVGAAFDTMHPLHRQWSAALEEGLRMSLEPAQCFRLVLGLIPAEYPVMVRRFPSLERLETIRVPTPARRDAIAMWIAKGIELEQQARAPLELVQILRALSRRSFDRWLDFETRDDVLTPAPRALRRAMQRWRQEPRVGVPRRLEPLLGRLGLGADDLEALAEAETELLAP